MSFVIQYYNFWHLFILGLTVVLGVVLSLTLRKKSFKFRNNFMTALAIFNSIVYIFRVIWQWNEPWYNFWEDLPLHLCGMTVIIFPLAMLIKGDLLKNFCYFISSAGGIMALITPTVHFMNVNVYQVTVVSFFLQHIIITLFGILLCTLGIFRPTVKGALKSIGILGLACVVCHIVNLLITHFELGVPNYMFTVDASSNALLSLAYSIIPVQLLYLVAFLPLLLVFAAVFYLPFLIKDIRHKKAK